MESNDESYDDNSGQMMNTDTGYGDKNEDENSGGGIFEELLYTDMWFSLINKHRRYSHKFDFTSGHLIMDNYS